MSIGQRGEATQQPAPFKERLRAWWVGGDVAAPAPRAALAEPPVPRVPSAQRDRVEPLALWESPAMRIAQLAWGEGCSEPGGAERLLNLARPWGSTRQRA